MTPLDWRATLGKALRPVLETTALDRVKYVGPVRRFARDWAIAFGFWDDGVLASTPPPATAAKTPSADLHSRGASAITLYGDPSEGTTTKMRALLGELGVSFSEVDISDDEASRKWLAEENDGARPPQLFALGRRVGGLEEVRALAERGELDALLRPGEEDLAARH